MSEMHYDHDQSERDYYDRMNSKRYQGCLLQLKVYAVMLILLMLCLWLLVGCKDFIPPVTEATGTVISVDGDQVLVAFEVINKEKGSQGSNWFYCPKHTFKKGDRWPDLSKYKPIKQ